MILFTLMVQTHLKNPKLSILQIIARDARKYTLVETFASSHFLNLIFGIERQFFWKSVCFSKVTLCEAFVAESVFSGRPRVWHISQSVGHLIICLHRSRDPSSTSGPTRDIGCFNVQTQGMHVCTSQCPLLVPMCRPIQPGVTFEVLITSGAAVSLFYHFISLS